MKYENVKRKKVTKQPYLFVSRHELYVKNYSKM